MALLMAGLSAGSTMGSSSVNLASAAEQNWAQARWPLYSVVLLV